MSSEALANIRTIAGLAKESAFVDLYEQQLEAPYRSAKKKANIYGICFGFAQCVIFMAYAASFRYGGYLVSSEGLNYMVVFRSVFTRTPQALFLLHTDIPVITAFFIRKQKHVYIFGQNFLQRCEDVDVVLQGDLSWMLMLCCRVISAGC